MNKLRSLAKTTAVILGLVLLAWVGIATFVFGFRHPWATDTERLIHIGDAMLFRKVPYSEMRDR